MENGTELSALAAAAAARMLQLLTTEGWEKIKSSVASLWRHSHPERVESDLDEVRSDLLKARHSGRDKELHGLLLAEWQARLARLLATRPEALDELRELLRDQDSGATERRPRSSMTLEAHVSGGGNSYQAGRDLRISKEGPA